MKRLLVLVLAVTAIGFASAQNFTIRRPADGSKVRETVMVRFPKNSVPPGGYVGIFINGKFLEAVVPETVGNELVYRLDSKARKIPDGKMTIEAVLYVDFQERPRIVNRTSVEVTLDNTTSIKIPANGLSLSYKWPVGQEWVYDLTMRQTISFQSQSQRNMGRNAAEIETGEEKFRYMYGIDQTLSGGDAMIRMSPLPPKGKDYLYVATGSSAEPTKHLANELAPFYVRMSNKGRPKFASFPFYFPLEGTTGEASTTDLLFLNPLPVLPSQPIRPGRTWQTAFLNSAYNLDKIHEVDQMFKPVPLQGSIDAIEWEQGIPTAKIRHKLEIGDPSLRLGKVSGNSAAGTVQELEETYWFDLSRGRVIRLERVMTLITPVANSGGSGSGGPGGGRPGGAPSGPGGPGGAEGGGSLGVPGKGGREDVMIPQKNGPPGIPGGQDGDGPSGPSGFGGGRRNGQRGGSARTQQLAIVRSRILMNLVK